METFSALLALCVGNSPVTGEFPAQKPVTPSFHVFFDLRLNKRLGKQSWGWWFQTPSHSLWLHCNGINRSDCNHYISLKLNTTELLHDVVYILSYWGWDKMDAICRRHFQINLIERRLFHLKSNFTEICSQWSNWKWVIMAWRQAGDKPLFRLRMA